MKLLLLGSGAREHALAWKICKSSQLEKLYVAPGNAGTSEIAENIAMQLEKRSPFRRTIRQALRSAQKAGADGIKVQIAGRLNGAEIARSEWFREGRVPLQTLRADIDYATKEANTIYGILGIKVWIFKNEILNK